MPADPNRRPLFDRLEGNWIVLTETTAHMPIGYQRKKWTRDSVRLTRAELQKLADKYLKSEAPDAR